MVSKTEIAWTVLCGNDEGTIKVAKRFRCESGVEQEDNCKVLTVAGVLFCVDKVRV